ncbi:hypothetical protein [Ekhidna sp.]|uniref:hypothetical protein n=1 Tax=Ekhidna sp. TaxID=2608089 RepID=UPI003B5112AD
MNKKLIISLLFIWIGHFSMSQYTDEFFMTEVTPPSPEAASLGKYAEQPVDLFSGRVKVEIPMFTVETGRIKLPISLSYHGSGVKVEEIASRVGLGWTLNAGGVVTKSVVGFADHVYAFESCPDGDYSQDRCEVVGYLRDDQGERITYLDQGPDKYYYNFPGGSGGFYFEKGFNMKKTNFDNLLISPTISNYSPTKFKIIDDNGIEYYFEEEEESFVLSMDLPIIDWYRFSSSWYLTKIYDPVTNRTVTLNYKDLGTYSLDEHRSEMFIPGPTTCNSILGVPYGNYTPTRIQNSITAKVIESIVYDQGKVVFTSDLARQDVVGDYAITRIEQFDKDNNKTGRFDLSLSHVGGSTSKEKRLVLNQVRQKGIGGQLDIPPYIFSYENMSLLPSRESVEKDIWGYFNNNNATTYNPQIWIYEGAGKATYLPIRRDEGTASATVSGSDRNCVPQYVTYGSLKKIEFPTGGYVKYEYEPHEFYHRENGVFQTNQKFTGGGIRIASVKHYSSTGELAKHAEYSYGNGFTTGSIPQAGIPIEVVSNSNYNNKILRYDKNQSALGSNDGIFIGYEKVIVKKRDQSGNSIGSTELTYNTVQNDLPSYTLSLGGSCGTLASHLLTTTYWPFHDPVDRSPLRGKLLSEVIKNVNSQKLREITYVYQDNYKNPNTRIRPLGTTVQDGASYYVESSITTTEQISLLDSKTAHMEGSNTIFSRSDYTYDNITYYLTEELTTSSEGQVKLKYFYPNNFSSNSTCSKMISMNYISPILAIHKYRVINGADFLVGSKVFEYKNFNGIKKILPFRLFNAKVATPQSSTPTLSYGTNPPASIYDLDHEFTSYTTHSKISSETDGSGITTSYLWTYDYTYPSVIGVNISASTLQSHHSTATANTSTVDAYEDYFRGLLTSDQHVQFYNFSPLIGINRMVDPGGIDSEYYYDPFNRLIKTTDSDGHIVNQFFYNFR